MWWNHNGGTMARKRKQEAEELKFEQTKGKKYGKKPILDVSLNSELTDISGPPPKRRPKSNKYPIFRENIMKNNRGNKRKNTKPVLIFLPFSFIIKTISNIVKGNKHMASEEKATKKNEKAPVSPWRKFRAIIGIGLALVVVSIAYSVVVILLGTEGLLPKIMLAPQAIFALIVLGVAFAKILK